MGVPKFFRYISERYPCLSQYVMEHEIPEFDNLYLDMNGIIHNCSHPDDDVHFRISEETIFANIFHYIEFLFRMIKPQKLFFMAIDGVAPRAKMNQQRGRRFRTAKDAEKSEAEALKKGEKLPETARFDSNCITPGTEFMAKLHEHLKYFIVKKISTNPLWRKCQIIYSGHETPGEGEHKIMDYIRYLRSKPNYDPNTRHCLYGLDADLIMLGLCTHDPHFSLLREEVKFGKQLKKTSVGVPEDIRFFLLHLSLMREYLEMEFSPLKTQIEDFDIEKIIDDWVLMGFLVGNDFIPHLPNLHIQNAALPTIYNVYMDILPTLGGYINENGKLNLQRFELFMKKLAEMDYKNYKEQLMFFSKKNKNSSEEESSEPEMPLNADLANLIRATEEQYGENDDSDSDDLSGCFDNEDNNFIDYKKEYYTSKLEYQKVTREVLKSQAEGYVRAIQWNLNYYYNGVCSWSWYYPHHYSPFISDIKGFTDLKLEYDLGQPFLPYQQLLAVLPSASKELLPMAYRQLMTSNLSPIKQFYPADFKTDLNGKKQDWEAVVLVPFIDENMLLKAMQACDINLTQTERKRNRHGPMLKYYFTEENQGEYKSPGTQPPIKVNYAKMESISIDDIRVPMDKLVKGKHPNAKQDLYYPGFPTFRHFKYETELKQALVKVFDQPSMNPSIIITVKPSNESQKDEIPLDLLDKFVYVGWPHLTEAKVVSISDNAYNYTNIGQKKQVLYDFKSEINTVADYYMSQRGINVGDTKALVKVRRIVGRKYTLTPNGRVTLEKILSLDHSYYPLQLILDNIKVYNSDEELYSDIKSMFPIGTTCFNITNPFYGAQGKVLDYDESTNNRVKISITSTTEPDLSIINNIREEYNRNYKNLYTAAYQLGMSESTFSRLTGSIWVYPNSSKENWKSVNIGLALRFHKKNLETPGYTKRIDGHWYYSNKAIDLVADYAKNFPEVIRFLSRNNYNWQLTFQSIFLHNYYDKKGEELVNWIKAQPHYKIQRVNCSNIFLDKDLILQTEKIVDNFKEESKSLVLHIKPNFLFKPGLTKGYTLPDPQAKFELLDRVINIQTENPVPFALKGTIIGLNESNSDHCMYNVMFDKPFENGLKKNTTSERCYRLSASAMINISHGLRMLTLKVGKPGELINAMNTDNKNSQMKLPYMQTNNLPMQNPQNSAFAFYNFNAKPQMPFNSSPQFNRNSQNLVNYSSQSNQTPQMPQPPYYFNGQPIYQQPVGFWDVSNLHQQNFVPSGVEANLKVDYMSKECGNMLPNFSKSRNEPQPFSQHSEPPNLMPNFFKNESQEDTLKKLLKIDQNNKNDKNQDDLIDKLQSANLKENTPIHSDNPRNSKSSNSKHSKAKPSKNQLGEIKIPKTQQVNSKSKQKTSSIASTNKISEDVETSKALNQNEISIDKELSSGKSPSVILLSYYQSQGLGLPRYQYFEGEHGIQSQIKLPNLQIILGAPAKTRDEASEDVAKKALAILLSKDLAQQNKEVCVTNFPTPPKKWVQEEHPISSEESNKHSNEKLKPKQDDHSVVQTQDRKNGNENDWKGLVPLQVQKKATKANSKQSLKSKNLEIKEREQNASKEADEKTTKPNSSANKTKKG